MRNVRLSLLAALYLAFSLLRPYVAEAGQIPIFTGTTQLTTAQLVDYNLTIQGATGTGATLIWPQGLIGQWNITNNTAASIQIQYPGQATSPLLIAQGVQQAVYGNGQALFAQARAGAAQSRK